MGTRKLVFSMLLIVVAFLSVQSPVQGGADPHGDFDSYVGVVPTAAGTKWTGPFVSYFNLRKECSGDSYICSQSSEDPNDPCFHKAPGIYCKYGDSLQYWCDEGSPCYCLNEFNTGPNKDIPMTDMYLFARIKQSNKEGMMYGFSWVANEVCFQVDDQRRALRNFLDIVVIPKLYENECATNCPTYEIKSIDDFFYGLEDPPFFYSVDLTIAVQD